MPAALNSTRVVILPSYNSGPQLARTMAAAREAWSPVWAVVDGSTDGSVQAALELGADGFRVLRMDRNSGKGGAVLHALREAHRERFTHALVMDADGQHPAESIRPFMELSVAHPEALVAGVPVFGPDAPAERVKGRKIGNCFARIATLGRGAQDSLFGFRVYPVAPALKILESTTSGRRFDFDTVLAVRLAWAGVPAINRPVPVRYPPRAEGGVTHFRYVRDNLLLTSVHARLFFGMLPRIPRLLNMHRKCH